MAIAQPTRDCAANRLALTSGLVQLTARYKQSFLPPVKCFLNGSTFLFESFVS